MPFLFTFMLIPGIVVVDITFERRKRYMLKKAEKMGITQKVEAPTF